jgi:hypothetical protein
MIRIVIVISINHCHKHVLGLRIEERPPAMEVSCKYIELADADKRQWVVLQFRRGANNPSPYKIKLVKSLGPGRILWINDPSYGIWI